MVANYPLELDKNDGGVWSRAGWLLLIHGAQTLPMIRSRMLVEIKIRWNRIAWKRARRVCSRDAPHIKGLWGVDGPAAVGHAITCSDLIRGVLLTTVKQFRCTRESGTLLE